MQSDPAPESKQKRRPRYAGKYPRRFDEKYKEHNPERYAETVARVLESGKTPAGAHRPIMVAEILEALEPKRGDIAVDCTLGYGGHAREILTRIQPGGRLIGLDRDPVELPKTRERLAGVGFGPEQFTAYHSNFAGLPKILGIESLAGADCILADLGVSSMQIDDPARGFSVKLDGPLDMRMDPQRGQAASRLLEKIETGALVELLVENADEPHADLIGAALAGHSFAGTTALAAAIRAVLPKAPEEERDLSVRRVFQALRIAVNDEFSALEMLLRNLPACLNPGGRAAILTFHSGEDRRVKKALESGLRDGVYPPSPGKSFARRRPSGTRIRARLQQSSVGRVPPTRGFPKKADDKRNPEKFSLVHEIHETYENSAEYEGGSSHPAGDIAFKIRYSVTA